MTRLTNLDMPLMVVENNITTNLALLALAKVLKDEGKLDLFQFIVTKGVYSYKRLNIYSQSYMKCRQLLSIQRLG